VTRAGAAMLKRERSRKNAYLARRLQRLGEHELDVLEQAAAVIERVLAEDKEAGR